MGLAILLIGCYAEEIAGKWNPKDPNSGFAGVVTVFDVHVYVANRYERKVVGGRQHEELWVPAEEQLLLEAAFTTPIRPIVASSGLESETFCRCIQAQRDGSRTVRWQGWWRP